MPTLSLPKKILPPNIQVFIVPIVLLAVLAVVSIFVARVGFARFSSQRQELETAIKSENILTQKESLLRELEAQAPAYVRTVAAVLPEKNPALTMVSQVKSLSALQGLTLGNFKVASATNRGTALSEVDVSFGVDGPLAQVITFLNSLKTLAPVSTLEKVKINQSAGTTRADITVRVYFATFPTQLPSLTEPARGLTAEEKDMLAKLSVLTLPSFIELVPQPGVVRENPFE